MKTKSTKKAILALFGALCFGEVSYAAFDGEGFPLPRRGIVTFAGQARWAHHLNTVTNEIVYEARASQRIYYKTIENGIYFELNSTMGDLQYTNAFLYRAPQMDGTINSDDGYSMELYRNNFTPIGYREWGDPPQFAGDPIPYIKYMYKAEWYTEQNLSEMPFIYAYPLEMVPDLIMDAKITTPFSGQYYFWRY